MVGVACPNPKLDSDFLAKDLWWQKPLEEISRSEETVVRVLAQDGNLEAKVAMVMLRYGKMVVSLV